MQTWNLMKQNWEISSEKLKQSGEIFCEKVTTKRNFYSKKKRLDAEMFSDVCEDEFRKGDIQNEPSSPSPSLWNI